MFVAKSLAYLLPDSIAFGDVWGTHVLEKGVFFQTSHYIFKISDRIEVWHSETGFHNSFSLNESLFVREKEVGLLSFQDGDFKFQFKMAFGEF